MWRSKLQTIVSSGKLTLITPSGEALVLGGPPIGRGPRPPEVVVRLRGAMTPVKIALDPYRYFGEAYMDGNLVLEQGTLWDLLELVGYNLANKGPESAGIFMRLGNKALQFAQQYNDARLSQRNVAHHYDLSESLYRLFLDVDMQYSCAYFKHPSVTLDQAQYDKKVHIAQKLMLRPGMRVLDIGCGWGGMALHLAREHDVHVLGVTLSKEQLAIARARAEAKGLADRVKFELIDYRKVEGTFDRVVSVGMFEHVGVVQFDTYFRQVARLLKPDGVALIHSIGRITGPSRTSGFIRKYIFPGGYIPALSEVTPSVERSGLWLTDLEILRLHYAETLRHWRERFMARKHELAGTYDERFNRMWEFYLASSEMSFRYNGFMVFQAQLTRDLNALPITRTYMLDEPEFPMSAAAE